LCALLELVTRIYRDARSTPREKLLHLATIPRSFGAHRRRQRIDCRVGIYSKVTTCRENEFETGNWRLVLRKSRRIYTAETNWCEDLDTPVLRM